MNESKPRKTYSTFGFMRSFRQVAQVLRSKRNPDRWVTLAQERLQRDEERIVRRLGMPLRGLRILEVGPGQKMERARYFGVRNEVTAMDLDVIPRGFSPVSYFQMLKENGFGRFAKTMGRKLFLVDRANKGAWKKALGTDDLQD